MPRKKQIRGRCTYCGQEFARSGMAKHLSACPQRLAVTEQADSRQGADDILYHLQVQDAYGGDYWLHLEMRGTASLKDLDRYLRGIWLECCDHLSRFSFIKWGPEISKGRKASQVLVEGVELNHIYDFGTSSETKIKVVGSRVGKPTTKHPIALMARNEPPEVICMECDQPATWLCIECMEVDDTPGTLCDEHVKEHPHHAYGEPMPLVNSPRCGMCGYYGPAEPPY